MHVKPAVLAVFLGLACTVCADQNDSKFSVPRNVKRQFQNSTTSVALKPPDTTTPLPELMPIPPPPPPPRPSPSSTSSSITSSSSSSVSSTSTTSSSRPSSTNSSTVSPSPASPSPASPSPASPSPASPSPASPSPARPSPVSPTPVSPSPTSSSTTTSSTRSVSSTLSLSLIPEPSNSPTGSINQPSRLPPVRVVSQTSSSTSLQVTPSPTPSNPAPASPTPSNPSPASPSLSNPGPASPSPASPTPSNLGPGPANPSNSTTPSGILLAPTGLVSPTSSSTTQTNPIPWASGRVGSSPTPSIPDVSPTPRTPSAVLSPTPSPANLLEPILSLSSSSTSRLPSYVPRPSDGPYVPRPSDGPYLPRPSDGPYVPRPSDGSFSRTSSSTVVIPTPTPLPAASDNTPSRLPSGTESRWSPSRSPAPTPPLPMPSAPAANGSSPVNTPSDSRILPASLSRGSGSAPTPSTPSTPTPILPSGTLVPVGSPSGSVNLTGSVPVSALNPSKPSHPMTKLPTPTPTPATNATDDQPPSAPSAKDSPTPSPTLTPKPPTTPTFVVVKPTATITDSQSWLPSIIVEASASFNKPSEAVAPSSPSSLPADLPKVIIGPDPNVQQPKDTVLLQIGFLYGENYLHVSKNPNAAAQIFTFLPKALADAAGLDINQIRMTKLVPYDTTQTLHYITTIARFYYPRSMVDKLRMDIKIPNSALYNNPDQLVYNLTQNINPAIDIFPGMESDGSFGSRNGPPPPLPNANTNDPLGGEENSNQSPMQKGTAAAIGIGAVGVAAAYGAAMFIIARRYKQKRQAHRRVSSLNSSEMRYQGAGGTPVMGGALMSRDFSNYVGNPAGRESRGSGPSGMATSARTVMISAPVAAENSLGWN